MNVRPVAMLIVHLILMIVAATATAWLTRRWEAPASGHEAAIRGAVRSGATCDATFDDVGGYAATKRLLRHAVVKPLRYAHIFYDPTVPALHPPCGLLLSGPPGTGKTLLVKACARESGANIMSLNPAVLESKWWGETPKLLETAFRLARELAPCIVFFDEIDSIGRARNDQDQNCVYSLKCELLRHLDGIGSDRTTPVIVLACTNCPERLDGALRRRFPRHVPMHFPCAEERRHILKVHLKGEVLSDKCLQQLVDATKGRSGADVATVVAAACAQRAMEGHESIDASRTESAREYATKLGPLRWRHFQLQSANETSPND